MLYASQSLHSGLNEDEHQNVAEMDVSTYGTSDDVAAVAGIVPLGEEDLDTSHEGGEYKVFENLREEIASSTG